MKHETKENTGVSALLVFCQNCREGRGRHFALIHNGYGEAAEEITQADMEAAHLLGNNHEAHTGHEVVIYHYKP